MLELEREVARGLESILLVLLETPPHDGHGHRRQAGVERERIRGFRMHHGVHRLEWRLALKRALAGEHLVQHGAEREDVGAVIDRLASHLLGRHVAGRAVNSCRLAGGVDVSLNVRVRLAELRDAEIEELRAPVVRDEHVGGFDVAVPDVLPVRRVQRAGDLGADLDGPAERQQPRSQFVAERLTIEELRDDERHAVLGADVVHRDDVRMVQAAGGVGLSAESRDLLWRGGRPAHDLERDVAHQARVVRPVHDAHAPLVEQADDPVRTKMIAGRQPDLRRGRRLINHNVPDCAGQILSVFLENAVDNSSRHSSEVGVIARAHDVVDLDADSDSRGVLPAVQLLRLVQERVDTTTKGV